MPSRIRGQSLTEYSIVFALVIIVAIASVVLMGRQGSDSLDKSNQALFGQGGNGNAVQLSGLLSESNLNIPGASTVSVTLNDGAVLTLQNYPSNLSQAVETVGADGTTDLLVANLRSLAKQLKDGGKISEDQFNHLNNLANQGHSMASLQRSIEAAAHAAKGSKSDFLKTSLLFNNAQGSPNAISSLLVVGPQRISQVDGTQPLPDDLIPIVKKLAPATLEILKGFSMEDAEHPYVGAEALAFFREYQQVSQDGTLNEPQINRIVSNLVSNIYNIGERFTYSTSLTALPVDTDGHDADLTSFTPGIFNKTVASNVTNLKSADICSTGGGTDSGIHCPKTKG